MLCFNSICDCGLDPSLQSFKILRHNSKIDYWLTVCVLRSDVKVEIVQKDHLEVEVERNVNKRMKYWHKAVDYLHNHPKVSHFPSITTTSSTTHVHIGLYFELF